MSAHAPTPWSYRDVAGAGIEIFAPVYKVTGVELPRGMPEAPIMTFALAAPQNVLVAYERWVQFEPQGWSEMQEANAAFIVKSVNEHADAEKALLELCGRHGFATGHGDTSADIISEIDGQISERMKRIADKAREWSSNYPQSSDGRNTFVLFAEWVEGLAPHRSHKGNAE